MRVAINSNYKSAGDLFAAGSLCALICDCHGLADAAARRAPDRDGHRTFSGSRSFFVQFGVVLCECQLLRITRKCYGFLGRFTVLWAYGKYLTGFGGFTGLYFFLLQFVIVQLDIHSKTDKYQNRPFGRLIFSGSCVR